MVATVASLRGGQLTPSAGKMKNNVKYSYQIR
jgi:hypothetical protein